MADFLSDKRKDYYKLKKLEQERKRISQASIIDDARYIRHYGMSAYLELFPEAAGFGMEWHKSIVAELEYIEQKQEGELLAGIASAYSSVKSRKANRAFKHMIKDMVKRKW